MFLDSCGKIHCLEKSSLSGLSYFHVILRLFFHFVNADHEGLGYLDLTLEVGYGDC